MVLGLRVMLTGILLLLLLLFHFILLLSIKRKTGNVRVFWMIPETKRSSVEPLRSFGGFSIFVAAVGSWKTLASSCGREPAARRSPSFFQIPKLDERINFGKNVDNMMLLSLLFCFVQLAMRSVVFCFNTLLSSHTLHWFFTGLLQCCH